MSEVRSLPHFENKQAKVLQKTIDETTVLLYVLEKLQSNEILRKQGSDAEIKFGCIKEIHFNFKIIEDECLEAGLYLFSAKNSSCYRLAKTKLGRLGFEVCEENDNGSLLWKVKNTTF